MITKRLILIVFVLLFSVSYSLFTAITVQGEVSLDDLRLEKPRLLPTSSFYFLKEWRRGFSRFFTFNPVAKARLELKFIHERAAEIKVLEDLEEEEKEKEKNIQGIQRAIDNYYQNIQRLGNKLASLEGTSENPNIDRLLDELTGRFILHQELFDDLKSRKIENDQGIAIDQIREEIDELFARTIERLDDLDKFERRLEKVAEKQINHAFKEVYELSILLRLSNKFSSDEVQKKVLEIQQDLISEFEGRLKANQILFRDLPEMIEALPINGFKHKLEVLDFLRERVSDESIKTQLGIVRSSVFENMELGIDDFEFQEKAKEALNDTEGILMELEKEISDSSKISSEIKDLFERARFNFDQAQKFYEAGDYRRTIGQVISAEVTAKSALVKLGVSKEDISSDVEEFKKEFDELKNLAKEKSLTVETDSQLFKLFDEVELEIGEIANLVSQENISQEKLLALNREIKIILASIEALIE